MVGAETQMRLGWFCPSWVPSTSLLLLVAVKEKKKKKHVPGTRDASRAPFDTVQVGLLWWVWL